MLLRLHQFSVGRGAKGCQIYRVFTRVVAVATVKMKQTSTQRSLRKKYTCSAAANMSPLKIKNKMEKVIAE